MVAKKIGGCIQPVWNMQPCVFIDKNKNHIQGKLRIGGDKIYLIKKENGEEIELSDKNLIDIHISMFVRQ